MLQQEIFSLRLLPLPHPIPHWCSMVICLQCSWSEDPMDISALKLPVSSGHGLNITCTRSWVLSFLSPRFMVWIFQNCLFFLWFEVFSHPSYQTGLKVIETTKHPRNREPVFGLEIARFEARLLHKPDCSLVCCFQCYYSQVNIH